MRRKGKILSTLMAMLLLTGCSMRTTEQLYCLPKRSQGHAQLQQAIDRNMDGRDYCAPLSGEHLQSVQRADLDGDGEMEYLLFAKASSDKPLQILIFQGGTDGYVLRDVIENSGAAYDMVTYAQMDDTPGEELVVGRQVSNQVARSLSVYRFQDGKAQQILNANYSKFLICDLDSDGSSGVMVFRPGGTEESYGVAEHYQFTGSKMERSNEASMSAPVDRMKRVVVGKLQDDTPAVYVASAVGENSVITDVFAQTGKRFTNISLSAEAGTSVQTLRNYYVYAADVDNDGVVELPSLLGMRAPADERIPQRQYLIRWFALKRSGEAVEKAYTYHNFQSGWYLHLGMDWAERMTVIQRENSYEFHLWDEEFQEHQCLFTVYAFSGSDREELAAKDNRQILYRGEYTIYSAYLEVASASYGITQESLVNSFHPIHTEWNSGET